MQCLFAGSGVCTQITSLITMANVIAADDLLALAS
jgi:hypothetical protein